MSRDRERSPFSRSGQRGPVATSRVDTAGRERNARAALAASTMPHIAADVAANDAPWERIGFDRSSGDDLTRFRGIASGRHIIMISLESTAAPYIGLYGAAPDVMPNLTKLAASALVFDSAYAAYPESIKGLYSILCAAYPAFDVDIRAYAAPCDALPSVLATAGYHYFVRFAAADSAEN